MIGAARKMVGQAVGGTGESPEDDRQDETVSEFGISVQSCYSGWPGGYCLRAPKAQEVPNLELKRPQSVMLSGFVKFDLLSLCDPDV